MTRDPYNDFALVYDAWQKLYPRPFSMAMAPRIRQAVRAYETPAASLVDLACGTGTFARWWQRTHKSWTVFATDRSPAMIRMARRAGRVTVSRGGRGGVPHLKALDSGGRSHSVRYFVQELKLLSLPEQVGVATCMFDSLNHVTRASELRRIFARVHHALAPGGLFLFDLVDELTFPEVFTGSSIFDSRGLYLGMDTEYREESGRGIGIARFTFFRRSGSGWRRIDFRIRERRWFRGHIRDFLHDAGLDLVKLEKISPYTSREFFVPRTFWIARKPGESRTD